MSDEPSDYKKTLKLHVDELRAENQRLRDDKEQLRDENSRLSNENQKLRELISENGFGILFNLSVNRIIKFMEGK